MENYGFDILNEGRSYIGGYDKMIQSIFIILTTPLGSIPRRPTFGSRIMEVVFDNIEDAEITEDRVKYYTLEALSEERWLEVNSIGVDIDVDKGLIKIYVTITHLESGAVLDTYYKIGGI